jgi:holliday junction DNA helicase RuvA
VQTYILAAKVGVSEKLPPYRLKHIANLIPEISRSACPYSVVYLNLKRYQPDFLFTFSFLLFFWGMIAQLTGRFVYKSPTLVILECGGVGYEVHISLNTYSAIQSLEQGTLLTFLKISEDAHTLFGFSEAAEKAVFLLLIGVSGVGATTARMMLSSLKPGDVQGAILTGNVRLLESVKGIGKKTAERIVLELKDKVGKGAAIPAVSTSLYNTAANDALEALVALGINRLVAEQGIKKATVGPDAPAAVEDLIKVVLKNL